MNRNCALAFSLAVMASAACADPVPLTGGNGLFGSPAATRDATTGLRTVVFDEFWIGPSISQWMWLTHSSNDGATWSPRVQVPAPDPVGGLRIVDSRQGGASLLHTAQGAYLLFRHYGGATPRDIWRSASADGSAFPVAQRLDLGWTTVGSGYPAVLSNGGSALTMIYHRATAEAAGGPGLYLAQSADEGVSWDPQRTLVAADAETSTRSSLAYRASDGRYLVAYVVDAGSGERPIVIKATHDVRDWSAAPALVIAGNNTTPALTVMPDGAFVLLWSRYDGSQWDIRARRSVDGFNWQAEVAVTATPTTSDLAPFAVVGASPGAVDLYWSRSTGSGGAFADIVHDSAVVVLDAVFADGFDG